MFWIKLNDENGTVLNLAHIEAIVRAESGNGSEKVYSIRFYEPNTLGYTYEATFRTEEARDPYYDSLVCRLTAWQLS